VRTRSDHGHELIPRPERTPEALRAALGVIAPDRLEEMQAEKDETFTKAVEWQSVTPVQSWVPTASLAREMRPGPRTLFSACSRNQSAAAGERP
jgi:hypothetical protein